MIDKSLPSAIDPLSVDLIGLDQAAVRLAAVITVDQVGSDPNRSAPALSYRKRERATALLYEALCNGALIALMQDPDLGTLIRLIGSNWRNAAFWHDIIIGGNVRSQPKESVARYEDWPVVLETTRFERWLAGTSPAKPVDRTQKIPRSKRDSAIREILARVYENATTAGEKVPNSDQAYRIVKPLVSERRIEVSRDDVRRVAKEEEFATMRLKQGQRHKKR